MNTTFDRAFERLLGHEGGLSLDPKDKGNWTGGKVGVGELKGTKYGVSAARYPNEDIAALTIDRAKVLFWRDFWGPAGCALVPAAMAFDLFDTSVNSGPQRALKFLQRAACVKDDGIIGPITLQAVVTMDPGRLIARFNGYRLDFLNDNPELWALYGRGWAQRIAENLINA